VYIINYNQIPNTLERALGHRERVNSDLAKALTYPRRHALLTLVAEPFLSGRCRFCRHPAVSWPEGRGAQWSNIIISVRPERPSSIVAPNQIPLDGAAVDLTIVRPAAAAPPRRLEQVGPIAGRSDRGSARPSRSPRTPDLTIFAFHPPRVGASRCQTKRNSIKRNGDVGQPPPRRRQRVALPRVRLARARGFGAI
jgi:hypothetical protein